VKQRGGGCQLVQNAMKLTVASFVRCLFEFSTLRLLLLACVLSLLDGVTGLICRLKFCEEQMSTLIVSKTFIYTFPCRRRPVTLL
jgi:hypothetical protein